MASLKIIFESKTFVQVGRMQQQILNQMRPLGYEFDKIESLPISDSKIETTMTLVYKKKEPKKKDGWKTPWGSKTPLYSEISEY